MANNGIVPLHVSLRGGVTDTVHTEGAISTEDSLSKNPHTYWYIQYGTTILAKDLLVEVNIAG